MKKITRALLENLTVPVPPLETQRATAARLDTEIAATASLRTSLEARLQVLGRLPATLLREAFGGTARARPRVP